MLFCPTITGDWDRGLQEAEVEEEEEEEEELFLRDPEVLRSAMVVEGEGGGEGGATVKERSIDRSGFNRWRRKKTVYLRKGGPFPFDMSLHTVR